MRGATRRSSCSPLCARFQSTRPMRGATRFFVQIARRLSFQSTRPMRGATFSSIIIISMPTFQSTRPMRGATALYTAILSLCKFQSTRPMRGATAFLGICARRVGVSIHAPHAGRDVYVPFFPPKICRFNPRAPCGARLSGSTSSLVAQTFQSTRPMRGATAIISVL